MTSRRIASQQRTQVSHSAPGDSRKDALWGCHPHGKAHSGRATSRKSAFCVWVSPKGAFCMRAVVAPRAHLRRSVYTPASPRLPAAAQQCTQMPRNGSESPFSPICVHPCVPTAARSGATVYTNAPERLREPVFADLCTLLHTHGRSRDRAGPRVPRRRRPHGPRDARALGPEVHATGAVTQPPTHTNSRSLSNWIVHVACSR